MTEVICQTCEEVHEASKEENASIAVHLPPESTISKTAMNNSKKTYS